MSEFEFEGGQKEVQSPGVQPEKQPTKWYLYKSTPEVVKREQKQWWSYPYFPP
jgi:hypothetical protein